MYNYYIVLVSFFPLFDYSLRYPTSYGNIIFCIRSGASIWSHVDPKLLRDTPTGDLTFDIRKVTHRTQYKTKISMY